jgi:hypothetical protein
MAFSGAGRHRQAQCSCAKEQRDSDGLHAGSPSCEVRQALNDRMAGCSESSGNQASRQVQIVAAAANGPALPLWRERRAASALSDSMTSMPQWRKDVGDVRPLKWIVFHHQSH